MKRPNRKRRRLAQKASPTNPQYIFSQDATAALQSIAATMKDIRENLYLSELCQIRMEEELHCIAGELHFVQNRMFYLDAIPGNIRRISEVLDRPTFWQRLRLRVMNWRWRRRVAKGLPQKEWSDKTREALEAFEKRSDGQPANPVDRWSSVWR
jgi:hypothetical protein